LLEANRTIFVAHTTSAYNLLIMSLIIFLLQANRTLGPYPSKPSGPSMASSSAPTASTTAPRTSQDGAPTASTTTPLGIMGYFTDGANASEGRDKMLVL
jgi:hypothetical protein